MIGRARALAWPALVVIGALAPLVPGLLPGRTLAWRDSALLHGPVRTLVVEALREGRLPLWNPWEGGGQPLLGQSLHAALHPVSLLTAPFSESIDLFLASLVVAGALGAWIAARTLGCAPGASAVAAFAFGLSGYVLGMTSNAGYLAGAATIPWTVAGLRLAGSRQAGWLGAALGVTAAGLAGDPGALVSGIVMGLVLAWDAGGRRGLARAIGGTVLGAGGAAIQLLPTWSYLGSTLRGAGLGAGGRVEQWSLDLARLPELISPGLFVGIPHSYRAPVFEAFGSPADVPFPWAPSIFLGAPVLLLAVTAVGKTRTARALMWLALLFLWVSLGRQAGASQLLGGVPVWGALRFSEKLVAPLALCVGLAAAFGAGMLGDAGRSPVMRRAALAAVAALLAAAASLLLPVPADAAGKIYWARLAPGLAFSAVSLLLLAIIARWASRNPGKGPAAAAALVLLQSVAAAPFAVHAGSLASLQVRPPRIETPEPGPRILTPLVRNFTEGEGSRDAIDRSHAFLHRTGRPSANVAAPIQNAESYTGFGTVRSGVVAGSGRFKWALLRRLGATHVVAMPPEDDDDRETLRLALGPGAGDPIQAPDGVLVWQVPHRPWASFAPAARSDMGLRGAARALGEELAAGRETVVVEAPASPPVAPGRVLAVERRADRVAVEAESERSALLVVNDAFAPGWTAAIDGQPVEVLAADVLVRAVRWPAGRHRLTMRYEPPEVDLGIGVSAIAAVVALALLLLQRRRRSAR